MLATAKLVAFVPTRDAARARAFYETILGLRFLHDDNFALVFDSNGTTIRIARVPEFAPFPFTLLGWGFTTSTPPSSRSPPKASSSTTTAYPARPPAASGQLPEERPRSPGFTTLTATPSPSPNTSPELLISSRHPARRAES